MNAEFQRTAKRNKKAFLSDQCKEIEENNRMGKTRDFFKKISDTKVIFLAKSESESHSVLSTLCDPMSCSTTGQIPIYYTVEVKNRFKGLYLMD